jgi:ZIP family zinc transporter
MLLVTRGEPPKRRDYGFLFGDAIAPIVGAAIVTALGPSQPELAILLGITSGFFLFTATGDLLPDAHRRSPGFNVTAAMLAGLAFLALVVRLIALST